MVRHSLLLAACFVAGGCFGSPDESGGSYSAGGSSGPADSSGGGFPITRDESLDVYETVLRHQLAGHSREAQVYLSIDDRDVPAELLGRLQKDWPNLRQWSEAAKGKVFHVYADGLSWKGRDAAEVKAGYWFPTQFAGQSRFGAHRVVRKAGRWVVESVSNEVIGCG